MTDIKAWVEAETEYIMALSGLASFAAPTSNLAEDLAAEFWVFERAEELNKLRELGERHGSEQRKEYEAVAEEHTRSAGYTGGKSIPAQFPAIWIPEREGCVFTGNNSISGFEITPDELCSHVRDTLETLFPGTCIRTQNRNGTSGDTTSSYISCETFISVPSERSESSLRALQAKTEEAKNDMNNLMEETRNRSLTESCLEEMGKEDYDPEASGCAEILKGNFEAAGRQHTIFEDLNVFVSGF